MNDDEVEKRFQRIEMDVSSLRESQQADSKVISLRLEVITDSIKEMKAQIQKLVDVPAKRWDSIVGAILGAVGGGLVGYFFSAIIK